MKRLNIIIIIALFIITNNYLKAQNTSDSNLDSPQNKFALRIFVSPLMTELLSDEFAENYVTTYGYNAGADIVYYYLRNEKFKANISLGLGITNYRSNFQIDYENSLTTTDADNHEVFLTEEAINLDENQNVLFLDIPLKFGFEYEFNTKWNAYWNIGGTFGYDLDGKYSSTSTAVTRTGFYPSTNALIFDVDVPGSWYFYPTEKAMTADDPLTTKSNLSVETALGVKYKLNSLLSIFGGAKYMYGFNDVIDETNNFIVKHDNDYLYSLNTLSARDYENRTRGLGIELGVQINLGKSAKSTPILKSPVSVQTIKVEKPVKEEKQVKTEDVKIVAVSPKVEKEEIAEDFLVTFKVKDYDTDKILKASIVISRNDKIVKTVESDANGLLTANLKTLSGYVLRITSEGYKAVDDVLDLSDRKHPYFVRTYLVHSLVR